MAQNSGQGITIYDVAKKANVSISTVSRVFNNSPLVSSKTRKKVQKVIDEMGFVPSSIARAWFLHPARPRAYSINLPFLQIP